MIHHGKRLETDASAVAIWFILSGSCISTSLKFGPIGWLMGQTLLKLIMGRVLSENLNALAAKVETGLSAQAQTA